MERGESIIYPDKITPESFYQESKVQMATELKQ